MILWGHHGCVRVRRWCLSKLVGRLLMLNWISQVGYLRRPGCPLSLSLWGQVCVRVRRWCLSELVGRLLMLNWISWAGDPMGCLRRTSRGTIIIAFYRSRGLCCWVASAVCFFIRLVLS